MPYNPSTDLVGLWRSASGGVEKAEMPGLDFVVSAMARAGLIDLVTSQTAPTSNQSTTAWLRPANPSYNSEGQLFMWDPTLSMYVPATPELFHGGSSSGGGGDGGGGGTVVTTTNVFSLSCPTTLTVTASAWVIVPFTTAPLVDTLNGYDPISHKYTPTKAGVYSFNIRGLIHLPGAGTVGISLVKNDSGSYTGPNDNVIAAADAFPPNTADQWMNASCFASMNGTTDFVRMFVLSSPGTFAGAGGNPIFAAWLLP